MKSMRRAITLGLLMFGSAVAADDQPSEPGLNVRVDDAGERIFAPACLTIGDLVPELKWARGYAYCSTQELKQWQAYLRQYRLERRIRVGYDGSRYDNPALAWTQSIFVQPQMMVSQYGRRAGTLSDDDVGSGHA